MNTQDATRTSMTSRKICSVDECEVETHARGYCRKHYGQIWRKGRITDADAKSAHSQKYRGDARERLKSLVRELERAESMYDMVIGLEGRLKWHRKMEEVKADIRKIDNNYFANPTL